MSTISALGAVSTPRPVVPASGSAQAPAPVAAQDTVAPTRARSVITAAAPQPLALQAPLSDSAIAAVANRSTVELETTSEGRRALGSAVVVEPGFALTSDHVVASGQPIYWAIEVDGVLHTGTATVVGHAAGLDLALLQLNDTTIPAIPLRTEPMAAGDRIVLGGAPLGLMTSNAFGNITGVNRDGGYFACACMQTDAAMNHGNSGGSALDSQARLAGINSGYFETAQSIGFIIPATNFPEIIARLHRGNIVAPSSGLEFQGPSIADLARTRARYSGATIKSVAPGSRAARAGLQPGDRIESVNTRPIRGVGPARLAFELVEPGERLTLSVRRGTTVRDLTLQF